VAYRGLVPAARIADLGIELVASSWWGPNHHFVHYFVGAGARYLNWVAITPGEWRIESWTARGEVADALKEFEVDLRPKNSGPDQREPVITRATSDSDLYRFASKDDSVLRAPLPDG
jgi:hypothetical protein